MHVIKKYDEIYLIFPIPDYTKYPMGYCQKKEMNRNAMDEQLSDG